MQKNSYDIIIFLVVVTVLILFMVAFIVGILFLYRKKQLVFEKNIEQLNLDHEKATLNAQLEMQEQTFQQISREIHDNISLSLTLAKLQLNTFDWNNRPSSSQKIEQSIELLSKSIAELNQLSKGLNADQVQQQGLLQVVEQEMEHIRKAGLFAVEYIVTGNTVYMDARQELIIFRIIQEAFNNIIKHAKAMQANMHIHYNDTKLNITISDNGIGFDTALHCPGSRAGLKNIENRIKMLKGDWTIDSRPECGTTITFTIPYEKQ